ncbi:Eco57I restriction-modification methylase domain-containing protein (plasmid) [Halolamina sp. CBA1230]|uniref:Eco57I restriction-modification methylase domain-containing protein n=1 Tax=Halolamina sp. CBA1230 TaxID=1853690 RepID=UPI0009A1AC24|nr:N-6 DNA methylase [Halolamina sp. CBA1230]QKY21841.1 Eco57I restriction-modification methylase domain-containing protein [Halolamina sp. CBA1230]
MSQTTITAGPYRNSDLFSGYYLEERIDDLDAWDCDAEAEAVFEKLQALWEDEGGLVAGYNEDTLLGSWIDPVLDTLGYDTIQETSLPDTGGYIDRVLYGDAADRRDAMAMKQDGQLAGAFGRSAALLEAKQWDTDFTQRFSEQRSYRDASHQVKYYLEHTPESLQWGILTDGKKWRLYGTKDYATETYYEVDLPEILASGNLEEFKYFYLFFRPEAFREAGGSTFLETVWSESETAAQELGEDLQDNVFTALRVLGEGFVETNDLDIDPGDEEALAELKEQSLVLLYRLMFVLYAESRHLIDPEDPQARTEYRENFSLDEIRLDIHDRIESGETFDDAYSEYSHSIWSQLQDLFRLVDSGEESLGVSAYNGGLFDREQHEFLAENEVADRYIAEVIYRLGTTETADGSFALADYADLDTRHLGTIYEGLLEHEFRIAPEDYAAVAEDGGQVWKPATAIDDDERVETVGEGELYVVNDEGERKATGAYYTPDYVVSYIVEETVDPLLDELEADLDEQGLERGTQEYVVAFWKGVTDLRVLDPAMGSGHFLTSATEYLASAVMERVRELETSTLFNEQTIRREISRECIYGVDLNGMAVELAKLSMWLETLATDQPLAFLDHHLKAGNSLVGSDISEILGTDEPSGTEQATLFDDFSRTRRQALEHVMDLVEDLLAVDNETVADAKRMEDLYEEIRKDDLYERLFGMANVHTAERFDLGVPDGAYKQMANAIDDEDDWAEIEAEDWYTTAQVMAEEEQFFHWELEYPEVFFGEDGERKDGAGFDAVVGNPPYVKIQNIRQTNPKLAEYAVENYETSTGRFDLYSLFVEAGAGIAKDHNLGYILPNKFFESQAGQGLRSYLGEGQMVRRIIDFGQQQVFSTATTYTCLLFLGKHEDLLYSEVRDSDFQTQSLDHLEFAEIPRNELDDDGWVLTGPMERQALSKMRSSAEALGEVTEHISEGIVSGDNEVFFLEIEGQSDEQYTVRSQANGETYQLESDTVRPLIDGDEVERYGSMDTDLAVVYPYELGQEGTSEIPEARLEEDYPKTYEYLSEFKQRLSDRGTASMNYPTWYSLWCPRTKELFESPKLVVPDICQRSEFASDADGGTYIPNSAYGVQPKENDERHRYYLLAVLNSSPTWFFIYHTSPVLRGDFRRFMTSYLSKVPVPQFSAPDQDEAEFESAYRSSMEESGITIPDDSHGYLSYLAAENEELHQGRGSLNLSLLDHLGTYEDGQTLADIGLTQPPENAADSILQQTAEQKPNLWVGDAEVVRESSSTVEIRLTARYKPEDEDAHETDQWGYTETDLLPALRITDLTETEADLIAAFVPVAVDEADGFAGFRETATKTNSLVDRLRALTLPRVDDVADGLKQYRETKARADELDEKIQRTDDLIDEIVYELYGLTEEEIDIVEQSVQ